MKEINESNLSEFIKLPLSVIIFSSPWCTSCKKIASSLDTLSQRFEGKISFGICDISPNPTIASNLQVFSVPAVIIFKKGNQVQRFQGPVSDVMILRSLEENL